MRPGGRPVIGIASFRCRAATLKLSKLHGRQADRGRGERPSSCAAKSCCGGISATAWPLVSTGVSRAQSFGPASSLPVRALLTSCLDWVADCPAAGRSRRLTKSNSTSPSPEKATALRIYRSRLHRFERPWGQLRVVRCRSGRKITASCGSTKSFILNFDLIPPGRFANSLDLEAALDRRHDSSAHAFNKRYEDF